jgi:hypothetical protein
MEDELLTTRVPRALDMKTKLFGYELADLLLIFMNLAVTNLVFGGTSFRYPLVWGTTIFLALFLFFAKRGKPDNYIQHLIEQYVRPVYFAAGRGDKIYRRFKKGKL